MIELRRIENLRFVFFLGAVLIWGAGCARFQSDYIPRYRRLTWQRLADVSEGVGSQERRRRRGSRRKGERRKGERRKDILHALTYPGELNRRSGPNRRKGERRSGRDRRKTPRR